MLAQQLLLTLRKKILLFLPSVRKSQVESILQVVIVCFCLDEGKGTLLVFKDTTFKVSVGSIRMGYNSYFRFWSVDPVPVVGRKSLNVL